MATHKHTQQFDLSQFKLSHSPIPSRYIGKSDEYNSLNTNVFVSPDNETIIVPLSSIDLIERNGGTIKSVYRKLGLNRNVMWDLGQIYTADNNSLWRIMSIQLMPIQELDEWSILNFDIYETRYAPTGSSAEGVFTVYKIIGDETDAMYDTALEAFEALWDGEGFAPFKHNPLAFVISTEPVDATQSVIDFKISEVGYPSFYKGLDYITNMKMPDHTQDYDNVLTLLFPENETEENDNEMDS